MSDPIFDLDSWEPGFYRAFRQVYGTSPGEAAGQ